MRLCHLLPANKSTVLDYLAHLVAYPNCRLTTLATTRSSTTWARRGMRRSQMTLPDVDQWYPPEHAGGASGPELRGTREARHIPDEVLAALEYDMLRGSTENPFQSLPLMVHHLHDVGLDALPRRAARLAAISWQVRHWVASQCLDGKTCAWDSHLHVQCGNHTCEGSSSTTTRHNSKTPSERATSGFRSSTRSASNNRWTSNLVVQYRAKFFTQ